MDGGDARQDGARRALPGEEPGPFPAAPAQRVAQSVVIGDVDHGVHHLLAVLGIEGQAGVGRDREKIRDIFSKQ